MPILARTLTAPLVIEVRRGGVTDLPQILSDSRIAPSGRAVVAVGRFLGPDITARMADLLPDSIVINVDGGSHESAVDLAERLRESSVDVVVAIGGGGTIDVGKFAASMVGVPCVAVATTLTHDGLASPVAVLKRGAFAGSYGVSPPIGVVVDLDLVAVSPSRHIRSGIGDAVSNISAIFDWELAHDAMHEPLDGMAVAMARSAGQAVLTSRSPTESAEFVSTLADALILSGLAMTAAGSSRPCSGACHEISHAINALYPGDRLHGETVAVGTMFASFLRENRSVEPIDACFSLRGLPRVPADIGLSTDEFKAAVAHAPRTRPNRYTLLEHIEWDDRQRDATVDEFIERFSGS